jgi:histidine triad (HIT) family protein
MLILMDEFPTPCAFCEIVAGRLAATIIAQDDLTVAFLDVRQFHPGHTIVVSRRHLPDLRAADDQTAAAILVMVARVSRAVEATFPADGLSIWHSAGSGANQEVPHLHFHVHPRHVADGLLQIYPRPPLVPDRVVLDSWGARLATTLATSRPANPRPADAHTGRH